MFQINQEKIIIFVILSVSLSFIMLLFQLTGVIQFEYFRALSKFLILVITFIGLYIIGLILIGGVNENK
jgi:hypothetical protein